MSLCFRTFSNKFPPFVSPRKQVTQLDRQLPKQIKSSTFLEEFFSIRIGSTSFTNVKDHVVDSLIPHSSQALLSNSHNHFKEKLELFNKKNALQEQDISEYRLETAHIKCNKTTDVDKRYLRKFIKSYEISLNDLRQQKIPSEKEKNLENENMERCYFSQIKEAEKEDEIIQSDTKNVTIMSTDKLRNISKSNEEHSSEREDGRPSEAQLEEIRKNLSYYLPRLFVDRMDYSIYDKNIIFVNNIRGTVTKGFFNYYKQIALLRSVGHLKYAFVKLDVLKITVHPEDDSVKVRWRICGISGFKVIFTFWKFKLWSIKDVIQDEQECWHDGFSTFYINSEGKIYKHIADKMMPNQTPEIDKTKPEIPIKLAVCVGITNPDFLLSHLILNFKRMFLQSE